MKERPVLFSGDMVRAILDGRKTQTRRVMKPQIQCNSNLGMTWEKLQGWYAFPCAGSGSGLINSFEQALRRVCPYGKTGDKLWVRETFADLRGMGFGNDPRTDKPFDFSYSADVVPGSFSDETRKDYGVKWKPSIHMPRWASRITLEITGVRVERLQDISNADIRAEGACDRASVTHRLDFERLWESINGAESWAANPWVWVIEFKCAEATA